MTVNDAPIDPDVDLAAAESVAREWLPFGRDGQAIFRVMVEYDRRGAEIERLRRLLAVHDIQDVEPPV